MPRMTREQSQAQTRGRLIQAAERLFPRDGYAATSVERIAEEAGFSKGAFYSNFESKEAVFLAVLQRQGTQALASLIAAIETAPDARSVVGLLAQWADERSHSGIWSLAILEHARLAGEGAASLGRQREILRGHWTLLGQCVAARLSGLDDCAETVGALLHEIAYAPALTFMRTTSAGDVMRLALARWADSDEV